jgi:hypothetical protein
MNEKEVPSELLSADDFALTRLIQEWMTYHLHIAEVKSVLQKELELRKKVVDALFPLPDEGTTTFVLPEGLKLRVEYKLNRTVDEALVQTTLSQLRSSGYDIEEVFVWKPSLVTGKYRKLGTEARNIVDQALTTKPAAPSIEIVIGSPEEEV